jgi:hypothetical protein
MCSLIDAGGTHIGGYVALTESPRLADGRKKSGLPDRRLAIAQLSVALPGIDFRRLRREMCECRLRADALLDEHWPAVQLIANEFLWSKRLGREQLEILLASFDLNSKKEK